MQFSLAICPYLKSILSEAPVRGGRGNVAHTSIQYLQPTAVISIHNQTRVTPKASELLADFSLPVTKSPITSWVKKPELGTNQPAVPQARHKPPAALESKHSVCNPSELARGLRGVIRWLPLPSLCQRLPTGGQLRNVCRIGIFPGVEMFHGAFGRNSTINKIQNIYLLSQTIT